MISEKKYVGFDVCGTLFDSNTTFDFIQYLYDKGYVSFNIAYIRSLPFKVINKLSLSICDFDLVKYLSIRLLKGIEKKTLYRWSEEFYDNYLVHRKIERVHTLMNTYKEMNAHIYFISATIDCVAQIVSNRLGADTVVSSQLQYDNGIATGYLKKDIYGNKHSLFTHQFDCYVSDNFNDLELLTSSKDYVIVSKQKDISYWESVLPKKFDRIIL
ncbi:TPA: haloacid dehalogenase-like hydrolase [Vibrio harveyi]|nr:haloacid dehalogenase-like hydrolase [Vibrio harveyi]HDM8180696.1 haloacid dehalogenase-like hydrolase [Vibrio harveyi]